MAVRQHLLFTMVLVKFISQCMLVISYNLLYICLSNIEWCCKHVDDWIEDELYHCTDFHQVHSYLRAIDYILRLSWRIVIRLIALTDRWYKYNSDDQQSQSLAHDQLLACIYAQGPMRN